MHFPRVFDIAMAFSHDQAEAIEKMQLLDHQTTHPDHTREVSLTI